VRNQWPSASINFIPITTVSAEAVAIVFELKKFLIILKKFSFGGVYAMESRHPQSFSPTVFLFPAVNLFAARPMIAAPFFTGDGVGRARLLIVSSLNY